MRRPSFYPFDRIFYCFESGAIGFANTLCLFIKEKKNFPKGKDFLHYFSA